MQLKKIALILLCLSSFAARAASLQPGAMKQNLIELSGLKEGAIELVDGNEECDASRLRILEIDEDDHFTLTISLGAQPLIMGLGVAKTKSIERGCKIVEAATVADKKIEYKKTQSCGSRGEFEYTTTILVDGNGFQYTKINKDLATKQETLKRTCKYKFLN